MCRRQCQLYMFVRKRDNKRHEDTRCDREGLTRISAIVFHAPACGPYHCLLTNKHTNLTQMCRQYAGEHHAKPSAPSQTSFGLFLLFLHPLPVHIPTCRPLTPNAPLSPPLARPTPPAVSYCHCNRQACDAGRG